MAGRLLRTLSCSILRSRAGSVVGVPAKSVSSSAGNSSASEVSEYDDDDSGVEVRDRGGGETMDAGRSFQCSLIVPD